MLKNIFAQFGKKALYGVVGSLVPVVIPDVVSWIQHLGASAQAAAASGVEHLAPWLQALIGGLSTGLVAAIYRVFKYDPAKAAK